ncbi:sigma-54-dependent Fis family transcriptional regulator [Sediminispirochaeta bajacaliforniensis]|uniref:sigma-54-dependent Fis family transcriptional regulator n=1 Tax=Sediminispirochaeta bajacaliforniensis TaxID=148 RepID=UPI00037C4FB2|nr:sigma-54-dependent Fis family transcriptional regulator [Sediminispirochaeta bajacaliforniensis]
MSLLVIAPYPDLLQQAQEVAAQHSSEIIVVQGDLENGLKRAMQITESHDIDLIISRGGTASLLKKQLNKIVIEIRVTGYDLLRAIYPHFIANKRIALVGYENIIYGVRSISDILDAYLGIFTITQSIDVESVIEKAIRWGTDIIIGDAVSIGLGRKKGIEVQLIKSGKEAIENAVQEALQLREQMIEKIATLQRMDSIIEHSENGIIYIDSNREIKQVNSVATKCLQKSAEQLLNKKIDQTCLHETIKQCLSQRNSGDKGTVVKLGAKTAYIETVGLQVGDKNEGTIAFIQDIGKIQKLEAQIRRELSNKGLRAHYSFDKMITSDPANKLIIEKAKQYSLTDSTILLLGETGTGKEFFAQSIHNFSPRKNGPFVAVNCAALPDTLLESELFGYTEGAFTGANKGGKQGLFEMAHLGTIFLDEINEMNIQLQARFLRVLQEKEIMRVGDNKVISVDVRVIAASNKNLYKEVISGKFRSDLYYRIKVLDIGVLALRDKPQDIYPLFKYFIHHFSEKYGYTLPHFPKDFTDQLTLYPWPGNIRELKNFSEKFVILSSVNNSPQKLVDELFVHDESLKNSSTETGAKDLKAVEQDYIQSVLERVNYNMSKAAAILGINRSTLRRRLNEDSERE